MRRTETEGCLVCGGELEYLAETAAAECVLCAASVDASIRCVAGHVVCDSCHGGDAVAIIRSTCRAAGDTDLVRLFDRVRSHPSIPVHGPEHPVAVPTVIVTVARNLGCPAQDSQLDSAIARGRTVAGDPCGLHGGCGAALGVGTGLGALFGSTVVAAELRHTVMRVVSDVAGRRRSAASLTSYPRSRLPTRALLRLRTPCQIFQTVPGPTAGTTRIAASECQAREVTWR